MGDKKSGDKANDSVSIALAATINGTDDGDKANNSVTIALAATNNGTDDEAVEAVEPIGGPSEVEAASAADNRFIPHVSTEVPAEGP
eukprot:7555307-Pyramimonas_sp.AAC.1